MVYLHLKDRRNKGQGRVRGRPGNDYGHGQCVISYIKREMKTHVGCVFAVEEGAVRTPFSAT